MTLNHLFAEWASGMTIVAGTRVPPADPVLDGPRVVQACDDNQPRCMSCILMLGRELAERHGDTTWRA